MDLKAVKALVGILNKNDLSSIEITEGDKKIKIEKNVSSCQAALQQTSASNNPQTAKEAVSDAPIESGVDFNNITEVKSPMAGILRRAVARKPPICKDWRQNKKRRCALHR